MDNRKTERSSHKEFNATKLTLAAFVLVAFGAAIATNYISEPDNTNNAPRPNTPTQLQLK